MLSAPLLYAYFHYCGEWKSNPFSTSLLEVVPKPKALVQPYEEDIRADTDISHCDIQTSTSHYSVTMHPLPQINNFCVIIEVGMVILTFKRRIYLAKECFPQLPSYLHLSSTQALRYHYIGITEEDFASGKIHRIRKSHTAQDEP